MTFPVSNPLTKTWFDTLYNDALSLKSYGDAIVAATNSGGSASSALVVNLATSCVALKNDIATVAANSFLASAVVAMFNAQPGWGSINVATEFTTLNTLAQAVLTAVGQDFPVDGSGHLLDRTFSSSTGLVLITMNAAALVHVLPAIHAMLTEFGGS